MAKLTRTDDDGTTTEFEPDALVIETKGRLRELVIMDQIVQLMRGLNGNERKRIIAWLADRNENVGVD